jgi:hypothetical protein
MAIDIGSITGGISTAGTASLVSSIFTIMMIGGFFFALYLIIKRMFYWAEAHIYETGASGSIEFKKDLIYKKKDKKSGEIIYWLKKGKEGIPEPYTSSRYRMNKKYVCPLMRGFDGNLRPLELVTDYIDDDGNKVPYMKPIDTGLKDYIFQTMLSKTAKYKVQSALEKLAPYGVMALTVVVVIISLHLHNKGLGA